MPETSWPIPCRMWCQKSVAILKAFHQRQWTILQEESNAGLTYNAIVDRFLDKDLPRRFLDGRKKACWNGCLEDANEPV